MLFIVTLTLKLPIKEEKIVYCKSGVLNPKPAIIISLETLSDISTSLDFSSYINVKKVSTWTTWSSSGLWEGQVQWKEMIPRPPPGQIKWKVVLLVHC